MRSVVVVALALIVASLSGCARPSQTQSQAARDWTQAVLAGDIGAARRLTDGFIDESDLVRERVRLIGSTENTTALDVQFLDRSDGRLEVRYIRLPDSTSRPSIEKDPYEVIMTGRRPFHVIATFGGPEGSTVNFTVPPGSPERRSP